MSIDLTALSTQERMMVEHHTKRQDQITAEISALRDALAALQRTVAALAQSTASKVAAYEQSRLLRALRWLRLL